MANANADAPRLEQRRNPDLWQTRSLEEVLADTRTDRVIGAHVWDREDLSGHKVAYIYRHPRNVLISWARWVAVNNDWTNVEVQPIPREVYAQLRNYRAVERCVRDLRDFHGWREKADVAVKFTDLVTNSAREASRITRALGLSQAVDFIGDAAPWATSTYRSTWSGALTNWEDWWCEWIDQMWNDIGGSEIEQLLGYKN